MLLSWKPIYVGCRFACWWIIWFAVHLDGFRNRKSRGRGWRLHRGILAFLSVQAIYQTIHLFVVVEYEDNTSVEVAKKSLFRAEIFFDWLAKSVFLCVLLLISSGYCILRDKLGDVKFRVFGIPVIYGVTSMVFDYILLSSSNEQILTQQVNTNDEDELDTAALKGFILFLCLLIKAIVFVCAWVIVFESLNIEIKLLKGEFHEEVVVTVEEHEEDDEYSRPGMQDVADAMEHRTPDEPKTVADAVGDQAKLLLLTRFRTLIVFYVIASILVNILPLYISNASIQTIQNIISVMENFLLVAFIVILSIIFRPAEDNPYLLLDEEFEEGGKEVTTELGILANDSPPAQETIPTEEAKESVLESARFSLGGDETLDLVQLQNQDSMGSTPLADVQRQSSLKSNETQED